MAPATKTKPQSKIEQMIGSLQATSGASIEDLARITGWQAHSVRGALAGVLRKKGHVVTSEKIDGTRRYRLVEPTNG